MPDVIRTISLAAVLMAAALVPAAQAQPAPAYALVKTVPLGAPDRWDYVVTDQETKRVYIAHGDRLTVLDAASGDVVGQVDGMPGGTHGTAISTATRQGFTDDGEKAEVIAFDLKTLKVTRRIPAADDADGMVRDPATGRIFVAEGDPATLSVIVPETDKVVATIKAGEKMEYLAADHGGHVFVAGEANSDVFEIDARTAKVVAHWPTPTCKSPHGLALDEANRRIFMGCVNEKMVVVDARAGRVVAELPIGKGSDAIAFDPKRHRVFSSNGGDGTVTIYQQTTPDRYDALPPLTTTVSARNMDVDPSSGKLFVIGGDVDPTPPAPGARRRIQSGSVRVMIFAPTS